MTALALTNPEPAELAGVDSPAPGPATASAPETLTPIQAPPSAFGNIPAEFTTAATDGSAPATGIPAIPNPQPWQYDPVTNQHYDPNHGHWHAGLPPSPQQQQEPQIANPQPWQFDPVTNKHWNPLPGHNHWHNGPPPPPEQRNG